jgi:hypothetical protein
LSHSSRGNCLSTFKAPTLRNQNLNNLESHRVVFFRKSAGKLVKIAGNTTKNWQVTLYNRHATLNVLFCPNVSTTPITAMGCRQCLPLSLFQLKGKHCREPHCCNGVVDTFGLCRVSWNTSVLVLQFRSSKWYLWFWSSKLISEITKIDLQFRSSKSES